LTHKYESVIAQAACISTHMNGQLEIHTATWTCQKMGQYFTFEIGNSNAYL